MRGSGANTTNKRPNSTTYPLALRFRSLAAQMSSRGRSGSHAVADSRFAAARAEELRLASQRAAVSQMQHRQMEATWMSRTGEVVARVGERERCVRGARRTCVSQT